MEKCLEQKKVVEFSVVTNLLSISKLSFEIDLMLSCSPTFFLVWSKLFSCNSSDELSSLHCESHRRSTREIHFEYLRYIKVLFCSIKLIYMDQNKYSHINTSGY